MDQSNLCPDLNCERSYRTFEKFRILDMRPTQAALRVDESRWSVQLLVAWHSTSISDDYWCVLCDECYYTVMLQILEAK